MSVIFAVKQVAYAAMMKSAPAEYVPTAVSVNFAVNVYAVRKTTATVEYVPTATDVTILIVFYIHVYVAII